MTLFNNSDAAALLLPDGRFDRYYFAFDEDMSNVSISGGSPGLTAGASVRPLPAGYEIPLADLFGTGYPLPITLPNGGFVLELGGGTDLTELGQTISVDFGSSVTVPDALTATEAFFYPEDITIVNDVAYVSSLGDGTIRTFDLRQENPMAELFAAAEEGYTQAWGVKSDGNVLVSLLNNANFAGGPSGPAKLVEYNLASGAKTGEWDLPAGTIGHTVSIVDGKYYVTDFGFPQIFEVDPAAGTVTEWFTSDMWDPSISGLGGTLYSDAGAFYISQGNKMWYLPISSGMPGMLQEVTVTGLDGIDADGISWGSDQNTIYYATNDTGDPANVGTAYKLEFSDATTATGSVVATGFDDSSGLWYYQNDGKEYIFVLESQFGALFGLNSYEPPFNIEIIELTETSAGVDLSLEASVANQLYNQYETVDYTFTLTNEGDTDASNIEVDAMLPEGMAYTAHSATDGNFVGFTGVWTIPSLAAGESAILNVTLFTLVADEDITYFAQVVAADQADADSTPDSSAGEVTEDDEAAVTITPKANGGFGTNMGNSDLELSITADAENYNIYEVVGYTVSVTNNGPDMATGIEVSTPLPTGMAYTAATTDNGAYSVFFQTWTIDALGAGETATLDLDLFTLVAGQPITNFVQIHVANELDPDSTPGNNTTGTPTEDDEAAVTIQVVGGNNLPQTGDAVFSSKTVAANMDVSLAPNPFNEVTNFEIQLVEGGAYQLQVFDVNGKEVSNQRMELNEGVNTLSYDGSHLTNGLYSYLLSNNNGFVSGRMIVVD